MGLPWEINTNSQNSCLFVKPVAVLKTLQLSLDYNFSLLLEKPDLVEGIPARGRGGWNWMIFKVLPSQTIL